MLTYMGKGVYILNWSKYTPKVAFESHMRAVQVENGCFGDTKHCRSIVVYLIKFTASYEFFGKNLYGHSGRTSYFSFSHNLDGFPRYSRPTMTCFLMKMKLPVDCVST